MLETGIETAAFQVPIRRDSPANAGRSGRRLKLWQIQHSWLCSVIGTCLTPADIRLVLKRSATRPIEGAQDYEIHGHIVTEVRHDGRIGREAHKLLEQKYGAIVRKVGAVQDEDQLANLWNEYCQRGLVAGAYWALLSQRHVPDWLKGHAFGEVHMLSHFMGGFNRQNVRELWQAEREISDLGDKLASQRRRAREDLEERDSRIAALEDELQQTRTKLASSYAQQVQRNERTNANWQTRLERAQRRLGAARARLRAVEEENQRLSAMLDALADIRPCAPMAPDPIRPETPIPSDAPLARCILYVGGRCHLLPHLRARAEARAISLLHHEGGRGEGLQALESLVNRADAVFCPVDCISHHACLKAKQLCHRLAKPFVPLRSSSATCFARAMETWRGDQPAGGEGARGAAS
ncbi:MAG: DUF2325 domain-containing protein [Pseudomonadota bacterium]